MKRNLFCLAPVILLLAACGTYPFSVKKDLNNAEAQRDQESTENNQLHDQNQRQTNELQHVVVTDHFLWVLAQVPASAAQATQSCADIGYQVPAAADLSELLKEGSGWVATTGTQAFPFQITTKTVFQRDVQSTSDTTIAVCEFPRNTPESATPN